VVVLFVESNIDAILYSILYLTNELSRIRPIARVS